MLTVGNFEFPPQMVDQTPDCSDPPPPRSVRIRFRNRTQSKPFHWCTCGNKPIISLHLSNTYQGPYPFAFPNIGISQKLEFRAFLRISGRFYGDFRCLRAAEIHNFFLKSQFLLEIPPKSREIPFLGRTTWEGPW